jgi:DNA-directed RNA polymerase subunit RPC12/RpoP
MRYSYRCRSCGEIQSETAADMIQCRMCGSVAKRIFQIAVNRTSLRTEARWDPVVGQYVENHRDWEYKLRSAQERESNELGMEVKLAMADPRDSDALGDLHGWGKDARDADAEPSKLVKTPTPHRQDDTGDHLKEMVT